MDCEGLLAEWSRRRFVRTLLVGTGASMVVGRPWEGTWIGSVQAFPGEMGPGVLRVRVADFPSLQGNFGSVRLGFHALNLSGPVLPFILSKDGEQFLAVSAECTHANCIIPAFTSAKVSTCPCHGSRFAPNGRVLRSPATSPLNSYNVDVLEPGIVQVTLPEFPAFRIIVEQVVPAENPRVALVFLSLRSMQYEVQAAASATGPWSVRPFATTPAGALNASVFTGTGAEARLYVERDAAAGFFAVATKVRQV